MCIPWKEWWIFDSPTGTRADSPTKFDIRDLIICAESSGIAYTVT
jgi:hypothetical protein